MNASDDEKIMQRAIEVGPLMAGECDPLYHRLMGLIAAREGRAHGKKA